MTFAIILSITDMVSACKSSTYHLPIKNTISD